MPYVLSGNTVTFKANGKVFSVSELTSPTVFNNISRLISEGNVSQLESYAPSNTLEQIGLIPNGDNQYEYRGSILSKEMTRRVLSAYNQGSPLTPFINFWDKLSANKNLSLSEKQLNKVGTSALPLTWDGNLVLYKRSNWVENKERPHPVSYEDFKLAWGPEFKEGRTVSGINTLGTVNYVASGCPDAGPIYDVEVHPQHLLNVEYVNNEVTVKVSQFTYISLIDGSIDSWDEQGIYTINTRITSEGVLVIREPVTAAALSRFVAEGLEGRVKLEPQCVSVVGGSC